ncbi:beta-catenin-like protein 1, putative [Plasmodium ovale]|uniref:Beta-catenin-like protein 1, putative n=2 Tax=Plasmodium ovale TaxID=36330 RepID=A0A1A8WG38_PLAOA|nr:beta-catenin-like protein 1, putative [Plasmodium ovale curtisi]SBS91929.1 beta-catenin-like protein 1, putative [Plasmodium ovale curtisi]SCP04714.1 beta-catenin-like protein 1, putative [Plasmodium ovale]
MDYSDEDDIDIDEILKQAENVECIDENSIQKFANILKKKKSKNERDRIEHPDKPEKWVSSEVDLDEILVNAKNLSVCTNLYKSMVECNVFGDIVDLLNHPNNDIVIEVIDIIKEITNPSNLYELSKDISNVVIDYLNKKKLSHFIINVLEKINEEENEEYYNAMSSIFTIFENIFELENNLQNDLLTNSKLLFFLLKRISIEIKDDDSNSLYASEILVLLILRINQFAENVYDDFYYTISIFNFLLKYISKYKDKDPPNINKKEILLNCFQALGNLLLLNENKKVFESTTGLELMLKLLSERKFLCFPSLKIFAIVLNDKDVCNKFVELNGLKYLFCLFMLRNIKKNNMNIFEFEENIITIISNLCIYCTGTCLERVLNKFGEKKCEKIIRLLEIRQKYNDIIISEKKKKKLVVNENLEKMNIQIDEDCRKNLEYIELCDKGYLIYQLTDVILIALFFMNNSYISNNIFIHLYTRNLDIQSIYENILDFLDCLSNDELREKLKKMLTFFLTASKESNLFL